MDLKGIISPCIFCGCGCLLKYIVKGNRIVDIKPIPDDPVSEGRPCIKGLYIKDIRIERLRTPLVRNGKKLEEVDWDYALEFIKNELENIPPEDTLWIGSGEITNEDNYIIQKFAREVIGSENVDSCARLCHAPTMKAYLDMFGISITPDFIDDIYSLDTLLLVGTDPFNNYPAFFNKMLNAKRKGLKIICVDIVKNPTMNISNYSAVVKPMTLGIFIVGILRYLLYEKNISCDVEGFKELKGSIEKFDLKYVSNVTGVSEDIIRKIAEVIYKSKKFGVMHGMRFTQTFNGTNSVKMLTALVVIKKGKILTLRGKVNIQGCGDVGVYTKNHGLTLVEAILKPIKFMFCSIFNPALSLPALNKVKAFFKRIFIVHATPFINETSKYAKVILPVPLLFEREGTITTGEGRVRLVRKVIDPPEKAKQEWKILKELAKLFGISWNYKSVRDITREIIDNVEGYRNLNLDELYKGKDQFVSKRKKYIKLYPFRGKLIEFVDYPFILVTARHLAHFNTGDITRNIPKLRSILRENFVIMNKKDAETLGIKDGDIVRIKSSEGEMRIKVRLSNECQRGVLITTFHFSDSPINVLTPLWLDLETKIPHYKGIPVKVEKE